MTGSAMTHLLAVLATAIVTLTPVVVARLRANTRKDVTVTALLTRVSKELGECQADRDALRVEMQGLRADIASGRCPVCAREARKQHPTLRGGE